ncbi:SigE family RNA polymerase sigma factor [Actinomadura scrupuli]|uniref:SigE family RNA polymerase sigma factor n=1 Tax=Actinomadura scrupuli TaxID=559629 RepID=UPI003D980918
MSARDEEFRRFVAERSPALLRLAFLLCGDRAQAEDVLQTALLRAYQRWRHITTNPEAYVRRVLVTAAADERRRPFRRRELVSAQVPDAPQAGDPLLGVDLRDRLAAALRALPPRQRVAVVLRHWVGLTAEESAAVLGCSAGTVRSQTTRGLDKLRTVYAAQEEEAAEGKGSPR